jgi:surface antigen
MRKLLLSSIAILPLVGCAYQGQPGYAPAGQVGMNKTTGGALLGAGLGGLAGSQFGHGSGKAATTILGVLLGGVVGGSIGAQLDRADEQAMAQQTQYALAQGQPTSWNNPETGHYGSVTPQQSFYQNGQYCREYQQTVVIGGQTQQAYGTACRQPDGTWQIVQQ